MTAFKDVLEGHVLTTAEILYHLPDHPSVLQTYLWQDYDQHPRFPRLKSFLDFWQTNLDGRLYKVTVAHRHLVTPSEINLLDADYALH